MKPTISLDVIDIREPCSADWDAMVGDDRRRHCEHCDKSVHNLSAMPRRQAERLIAETDGRLCVQYQRDRRGRVRTKRSRWRLGGITLMEVLAILTVFVVLIVGTVAAARSPQVKHLWWRAKAAVSPVPNPAMLGEVMVTGMVSMPVPPTPTPPPANE